MNHSAKLGQKTYYPDTNFSVTPVNNRERVVKKFFGYPLKIDKIYDEKITVSTTVRIKRFQFWYDVPVSLSVVLTHEKNSADERRYQLDLLKEQLHAKVWVLNHRWVLNLNQTNVVKSPITLSEAQRLAEAVL